MEDLNKRAATARRALATLQELSGLSRPGVRDRDAAIKRFEYSFDIVWKTARHYLLTVEGIDQRSPKTVIRAARVAGLLGEEEAAAALAMTDDRNLTVHTYNEDLAKEIFGRLDAHAAILDTWVGAMETGLEKSLR